MKRFIPLIILVLTLLVISCNKEKALKKDLAGTWQVYKYTIHGIDETSRFDSTFAGYSISFTTNNNFVENYNFRDPVTSASTQVVASGTYAFKNNDQVLALITTSAVDSLNVAIVSERDYTMLDPTGADLQLLTDTSDTYMSKQ